MHVTQKMYHVAYSYDEKYKKYDSPLNRCQIGIKLGTKHVIYQKLANFL